MEKRYRLSAKAKIRGERFGGLIYCCDTQKLFLVSSILMPFLTADGTETAQEIAQRLCGRGALSPNALDNIVTGLERLAKMGVIDEL
ncbi:MAG: mycofactocin biosynthesis chaperone MftB [Dehalococcoidia bacterium]